MRIAAGDIAHKQRAATKLLDKHGRIRLSVSMRGREKARPEVATGLLADFCAGLEGAKMDGAPNITPHFVAVMVSKKTKGPSK